MVKAKTKTAAEVEPLEIEGPLFTGGGDGEAVPTAWTWSGVFAAIMPTVKQTIIGAILMALTGFATSFYKDYSGAAKAGDQVAQSLSTAGRDKVDFNELRITATNEANTYAINAMRDACADGFAKTMKEALSKPSKKG